MYREIETTCATALHRHNSKWLPNDDDIKVYRGCAHRRGYCYVLYPHEYPGAGMGAARALKQAGLSCGVHLMRVIPYLTSGE